MTPRRVAESLTLACRQIRIIIKLIIPNNVVIRPVVDLIECSPNRVRSSVPQTSTSHLERGVTLACIDKLLTKTRSIVLYISAKQARACCSSGAAREGFGVELKDEPPINWWLSFLNKGCRGNLCKCNSATSQQSAEVHPKNC